VLDLQTVIDLAIETCQPVLDARRHRFRRLGATGPFMVNGDAGRLVQVFGNLLENAAKYTPEGGKIVLDVQGRADNVVVTISDNGIGITAQALPHVFDMFVQDEHAAAHDDAGLGIGLAVVRELVEAHGGSVVADSEGVGHGSRFVVTLPLLVPQAASTAAA